MILTLFISLVILIIIGVPISLSLGIASTIFLFLSGTDTVIVVQRMANGLDSFPLLALPFFLLAGLIMEKAGVTKRLMNLVNCTIAHIRGGLAAVCVITSCFFGFISGSGVADTAAIGTVMMPEMVKKGYHKSFTAMLQAAAGDLGMIIPPSIGLVVIGIAGNISIGRLLVGGIIPGWLTGFLLVAVAVIISRKRGYVGSEHKSTWRETLIALRGAVLPLFTPLIIIGGILSGIFTPTEAAVVAVVYALILGIIYKEIRFRDLYHVFEEAAKTSAIIMFIISLASPFGWIMAGYKVPTIITDFFLSLSDNPIVILLCINLLLLLLGDFMETISIIIIMTPILIPLVTALGFDPIHFGVLMALNLAIGGITPPLGVCLMTTCRIIDTRYPPKWADWWPIFATMLLGLVLVIFCPFLVLWLAGKV